MEVQRLGDVAIAIFQRLPRCIAMALFVCFETIWFMLPRHIAMQLLIGFLYTAAAIFFTIALIPACSHELPLAAHVFVMGGPLEGCPLRVNVSDERQASFHSIAAVVREAVAAKTGHGLEAVRRCKLRMPRVYQGPWRHFPDFGTYGPSETVYDFLAHVDGVVKTRWWHQFTVPQLPYCRAPLSVKHASAPITHHALVRGDLFHLMGLEDAAKAGLVLVLHDCLHGTMCEGHLGSIQSERDGSRTDEDIETCTWPSLAARDRAHSLGYSHTICITNGYEEHCLPSPDLPFEREKPLEELSRGFMRLASGFWVSDLTAYAVSRISTATGSPVLTFFAWCILSCLILLFVSAYMTAYNAPFPVHNAMIAMTVVCLSVSSGIVMFDTMFPDPGAHWHDDEERALARAHPPAAEDPLRRPLPTYFADEDESDDENDPDFICSARVHWPPPLSVDAHVLARLSPPGELLCPISYSLMLLPVQTPMGTTYEARPLIRWIETHGRYPANERDGPLTTAELVPNLALRNVIEQWLAENR